MADLIRLNSDSPGPLAEKLKAFLFERVVGQERAIKDLVAAAEFYESGFRDSQTPIYVGMLAGPSGTGKTFMAEILAEFFFKDLHAFTKVDCSNLQHESDLNSLVGSPPGYVGFFNSEDPERGGAPPLLDQWNIDKHDFYRRQKKAGNLSVQEKEKKIQALTRRKQSLFNILSMIARDTAEQIAELLGKSVDLEKELREQEIRDAAMDITEALVYLCGIKNKKGKEVIESANQRYAPQNAAAKAKEEAMEVLLKHAELIKKTEPIVTNVAEQISKIDEEIYQLNQQNQMGYSPDENYLSVVLFDEIEKADPSLHNLLLEVSDKGRLVLRNGSITRFGNSIILLTSNAGAKVIERILAKGGMGFKQDSVKEGKSVIAPGEEIYQEVMREIKQTFTPPFLGRLDNIIVFNPLTREDYSKIFDLQVKRIAELLTTEWKFPLMLEIGEAVKNYVISEVIEYPEQGARMIKKKLRKHVMTPLVQMKNNKEVVEADIISAELEKTDSEPRVILRRLPRRGEADFEETQLLS